MGEEPFEVELDAGAFYWGDHLSNPIIHKVSTNPMYDSCVYLQKTSPHEPRY